MSEFWFAFLVGCFCGGVLVALAVIWYLCQQPEKQPEQKPRYDLIAAATTIAEAAWRKSEK